jgi:hypothetical protein
VRFCQTTHQKNSYIYDSKVMNCQRGSKVLPKNRTWLHTEEERTNRLQGLLLSVEELESVEARPYIALCTTVDLHQWPKSSIPTCKGMDRQKQFKQPQKILAHQMNSTLTWLLCTSPNFRTLVPKVYLYAQLGQSELVHLSCTPLYCRCT